MKWCLFRYLNPADCSPARIRKTDKILQENLILKISNFLSKLEIFTTLRKKIVSATVFFVVRIEKNFHYMLQKILLRDILFIEEKGKSDYVLIKYFNTFKFTQTLHRDRKHFCCHCLQSFNIAQILEGRVTDCFKINGKHIKVKLNLKTMGRKIKSPFMIYTDCESTRNNGKQNRDRSYTSKYQNHVGSSFDY